MLHTRIFNILGRTVCRNMRKFCAGENKLMFNSKGYGIYTKALYSYQNSNTAILKRLKSKGRDSKRIEYEDEEDEDLSVEDYLNTDKSKVITTTLSSLRLDAVAKAGLGISRAKLDKEFYNSNLRINGKKCLKKSILVQIGDEIDLIQNCNPDNPKCLTVNRCVLASVDVDPESETLRVKIVQNKSLLIENYDDNWQGVK